MNGALVFTLWDVEHGLAIWVNTPLGQNHWIDAGYNSTTSFSPAHRVSQHYKQRSLDLLVISHPDSDHIRGLPEVLTHLDRPDVFCRNPSLPPAERHAYGQEDYQKAFRSLDTKYGQPVGWEVAPLNANVNGGVEAWTAFLDYSLFKNTNDASVVVFYLYGNWLFVCPGDIGPNAWDAFYSTYRTDVSDFVGRAQIRVLVAPHHGRESGYSADLMDNIEPHVVLVSDKRGLQATDARYYSRPLGLFVSGKQVRCISTKSSGRIQLEVWGNGEGNIDCRKTT